MTVRIGSFNIRNGRAFDGWSSWPFRRRSTADAVGVLDCDIVGLQEVYGFQFRWLARRLPGYDAVATGRGTRGTGERCPVFVRRDIVSIAESRTRWYGSTPDRPGTRLRGARFPRIASTCRLELANGMGPLTVTNTHLDSKSAEHRAASVEQLAGWIDPTVPNVVIGDFNAVPGDPVFQPLLALGLREALGPEAGGTNHRFTGRTDGRRLDHILVSHHFEVERGWVAHDRPHGRLPSDHWPVVADLSLRSGP